jgi:predicted protein tyrosine phosphatase
MPHITVCSLADLHKTVDRVGASHAITLINGQTPVAPPVYDDNYLRLDFNDIAVETQGLVAPAKEHVIKLLEFVKGWDRQAPMVIHCFAGISRSTASAYIATLALEPERDAFELAAELRALSPSATPNPRLIAFADALLGRNGDMIAAIEGIGRGADAYQGEPFTIALMR